MRDTTLRTDLSEFESGLMGCLRVFASKPFSPQRTDPAVMSEVTQELRDSYRSFPDTNTDPALHNLWFLHHATEVWNRRYGDNDVLKDLKKFRRLSWDIMTQGGRQSPRTFQDSVKVWLAAPALFDRLILLLRTTPTEPKVSPERIACEIAILEAVKADFKTHVIDGAKLDAHRYQE